MGLEPYEGRYTLQLQDWTERAYKKRNIDYVVVPGTTIDDTKAISVGQVLDAHGRSYFSMSQMMNLVKKWPTLQTPSTAATPKDQTTTTEVKPRFGTLFGITI